MSEPNLIPWEGFQALSEQEMEKRSQALYRSMARRRSVRAFSDRPVPGVIIETCLATAGTAPSGANQQPWHFAVVKDPAIKTRIRQAAEACEKTFYEKIHGTAWSEALAPLATHSEKPFLTQAPYLVAVFAQREHIDDHGTVHKHYYVAESVGIALGLLITAVHQAGLTTLVYTPAPPTFLNEILDRPDSERALCILPIGYPAPDALVPQLERKSTDQTVTWY